MRIVAIIPARAGSKRLHRKNIYPVWGEPMLSWSIKAAKESKYISEVWVSTEDDEIKENEVRRRLDKLKKDLAKIEVDGETIH